MRKWRLKQNPIYRKRRAVVFAAIVVIGGFMAFDRGSADPVYEDIEVKYDIIKMSEFIEIQKDIIEVEEILEIEEVNDLTYMKITHYCAEQYPHICNSADGNYLTATGTKPTVNRTVAVDKSMIPLGSTIKLNGVNYIAEDVFGTDKEDYRMDILVATHAEALKLGVYYTYAEIQK